MTDHNDAPLDRFLREVLASFAAGQRGQPGPRSTADHDESVARWIVEALSNPSYPAGNAVWNALSDERRRRMMK